MSYDFDKVDALISAATEIIAVLDDAEFQRLWATAAPLFVGYEGPRLNVDNLRSTLKALEPDP